MTWNINTAVDEGAAETFVETQTEQVSLRLTCDDIRPTSRRE